MEQGDNYYAKTIEYMNKDGQKFDKFIKSILQPVKDNFNKENYGIIMDIGSGPGITTRLLAQELSAERCIGIDIDPQMIGFAERNNGSENIDYHIQDISKEWDEWNPELKKLCGKVSVIFSNQVLNLIKADVLNKTIENLSKLLSDSGVLAFSLISDYSARNAIEYQKWFSIETEQQKVGQRVTALRDSGLNRIDIKYCEIHYTIPEQAFIKYFIPVEKCFIKMRITQTNPNQDIDEILEEIIMEQCTKVVGDNGEAVLQFPDQLWNFFATKSRF